MRKNVKFISLVLSIVCCLALTAFGQETTGTLEITTKDATGAIVPGVTVTVTSTSGTAGFKRVVTTNNEGFQRILQVPPGVYNISTEALSGFDKKNINNVQVVLGKATPVTVELLPVGTTAQVNVTTDAAPIDTTDSKIQTNITSQVAELLPKGVGFASLLKVSPATRPEAKSGGYQVDGASGSENTFIIDGNEVTNPISGTLDGNNNLPFSIVQEVQVKSSGFEAEYGGATGGVINVVTRGGNNSLRGQFDLNFLPSKLQARRREVLYLLNSKPTYLSYKGLDNTNGFFPVASLSGPIVKNKVWFLGSYSPQYFSYTRTIPYSKLAPLTFNQTSTYEYAFGRVDAQPFSSLRLTSSYVWNPIVVEGNIPAISSQFDASYPSGNGLSGVAFEQQRGGRQNSNIFTFSGVWTPTSNFILSGRFGRNFLNNKLGTYGLPSPFPYTISNSRLAISTGSGTPPAGAGGVKGSSNGIPWADATVFDATNRTTYDMDATYITSFGGRHEFKGGYQYNKIFNNVVAPRNAYLLLYYGKTIDQQSGRNVTPTPGSIGTGRWIRYGAFGKASSTNDGIFFQDKWQPSNRLTLNLGVRFEQEAVPSFNEFSGIEFSWKDKFAPRLGAAFDLTGDGKTKVSAFFGWFYDRFKYELPRGSFGGNIYVSDYFELFDPNKPFNTYDPNQAYGSANPPVTVGGNCPQTGFAFGQIRCQVDHRVPSNDPSLDVAEQGGIDPNIKPYRQTELTFTFERELSSKFVFAARYTRKKLDRAVEDAGFITPSGSEAYIIGNPGLGLVKQFYEQNGWIPTTAKRKYDAIEFRLDRRFADDYYFNANYTYSRLYGNYSGLASSDEEGRTDPNVSRAFDAPFTEATIAGGETVGRLATDRPHVFKFAGAYSLDWNRRFGVGQNNTTEFQTFFTAQSGTLITTYADVAGYDNIVLNKRGDMGRTPFYTQTDFAVRHRYKFGRDNRYTFVADLDILNLFNQKTVTNRFNLIDTYVFSLEDPANGLITVAEYNNPNLNLTQLAEQRFQASGAPAIAAQINGNTHGTREPRYGLASGFQGSRSVRIGIRFLF